MQRGFISLVKPPGYRNAAVTPLKAAVGGEWEEKGWLPSARILIVLSIHIA